MNKKAKEIITHEEFWKDSFTDKKIVAISTDLQLNIARTKNGKVIDHEIWQKTLNHIKNITNFSSSSSVLELCCGNGVIIGELAKTANKATGVDYSEILLNQLKTAYKRENLTTYCDDVKSINLPKNFYHQIIIYFSIQHFSEKDTLLLIEKCISLLKQKGTLLIGDIPDQDIKWDYINKDEYRVDYFNRVKHNQPKIGNWFKKDFFKAMNSYFKEVNFEVLSQPSYQINSDHCFDVIITKK